LKSLVEGNNLFCQECVNSSNPILISNAEIFKRKDSLGFASLISSFSKHIDLFSQSGNKSRLNVLHPSLGSVGSINSVGLKAIQNKDFNSAPVIYFINDSFSGSNIRKLLNLKLLNFFQGYQHGIKILITQNSSLDTKLVTALKISFNCANHLHLPNAVFFETSGTYINTEGSTNKVSRVVKPLGQTKDN
jgi:hypothetical protein